MAYYDEQVLRAQKDIATELCNIRRLLYMKEAHESGVIDEGEWEHFLTLATEHIRGKR